MSALWHGDDRLKLIRSGVEGRAAGLNRAVAAASHDICLLADIEDISTPQRTERTTAFFAGNPDADSVSFLTFNESDVVGVAHPASRHEDQAWAAFAFRGTRLAEQFDESLDSNIEQEWYRSNAAKNQIRGAVVPYPLVYSRAGASSRSPEPTISAGDSRAWDGVRRLLGFPRSGS